MIKISLERARKNLTFRKSVRDNFIYFFHTKNICHFILYYTIRDVNIYKFFPSSMSFLVFFAPIKALFSRQTRDFDRGSFYTRG